MSDVIFARPRHDYHSYADLWELVRLANYPLIYIDEIDPADASKVYIFSTPDAEIQFPHAFPGARARIIYLLMEWYGDYVPQPGISEVWAINKDFAAQIGARFFPVGSDPGLKPAIYPKSNGSTLWDIAHLSYVIPRRQRILDELQRSGLRIAPSGWAEERHYILTHSRAMLHIHQQGEYPAIAPLRAALAAAYSLPLIAENGWSAEPVADVALVYKYEQLPQATRILLSSDLVENLTQLGQMLHQRLCVDQTFWRNVEAML